MVLYKKDNNNEKNSITLQSNEKSKSKNKNSRNKNTLSENIGSNSVSNSNTIRSTDIEQYRKLNPTHTILLWEKVNYDKHGNVINTEKIATNFESIAQFIVGNTVINR